MFVTDPMVQILLVPVVILIASVCALRKRFSA